MDPIVAKAAAAQRAVIDAEYKVWYSTTPRADEIVEIIRKADMTNEFMFSMARMLDRFGRLTPKQAAAVLRNIP